MKDPITRRLMENRINEAHPNFLDEDLQKYRGKPIKALLRALKGTVRIRIELSRPNVYGVSGYGGTCSSVSWAFADLTIKEISADDGRFNDITVNA